jgi:hypothetical protein
MTNIEKALVIIEKTNDGDDLSPEHLYLTECAVNGFLTEEGEKAFEELHQSVLAWYKKPWYLGIENLTVDHHHYVYWKGKEVEHFARLWTEWAKKEGTEVARRCTILECRGVEPSVKTVVWDWEEGEGRVSSEEGNAVSPVWGWWGVAACAVCPVFFPAQAWQEATV